MTKSSLSTPAIGSGLLEKRCTPQGTINERINTRIPETAKIHRRPLVRRLRNWRLIRRSVTKLMISMIHAMFRSVCTFSKNIRVRVIVTRILFGFFCVSTIVMLDGIEAINLAPASLRVGGRLKEDKVEDSWSVYCLVLITKLFSANESGNFAILALARSMGRESLSIRFGERTKLSSWSAAASWKHLYEESLDNRF